jgi:hypothetical protein
MTEHSSVPARAADEFPEDGQRRDIFVIGVTEDACN